MRFRNQFTEEFFGVDGTTTSKEMTRETKISSTQPRAVMTTSSTIQELPSTTENTTKEEGQPAIQEITNNVNNYYEIDPNLASPVIPQQVIVPTTLPVLATDLGSGSSFGGGGTGGGGGVEEEKALLPEEPKSKMWILWLILAGVGSYLVYKYVIKKK
jgi:hypothetical protein